MTATEHLNSHFTENLIRIFLLLSTAFYTVSFICLSRETILTRAKKSFKLSLLALLIPLSVLSDGFLIMILNWMDVEKIILTLKAAYLSLYSYYKIEPLVILYVANPIVLELVLFSLKLIKKNLSEPIKTKIKENPAVLKNVSQVKDCALGIFLITNVISFFFIENIRLYPVKFILTKIFIIIALTAYAYLGLPEVKIGEANKKFGLRLGEVTPFGRVTDLCGQASYIKIEGKICIESEIRIMKPVNKGPHSV